MTGGWARRRLAGPARRDQAGGVAVYVLGISLMLLLLVAGLGLADTVRAVAIKSLAQRSLASAVQSAVRTDPRQPEGERVFRRVLAANLGQLPYQADFLLLPDGGADRLTGRTFEAPVLTARLTMPFRPEFLGRWLPEMKLVVYSWEYVKRKASP